MNNLISNNTNLIDLNEEALKNYINIQIVINNRTDGKSIYTPFNFWKCVESDFTRNYLYPKNSTEYDYRFCPDIKPNTDIYNVMNDYSNFQ